MSFESQRVFNLKHIEPFVKRMPQWIVSKQGFTPNGALHLHSERSKSVRVCTLCNGTRIQYIRSRDQGVLTMKRCFNCKGTGQMIR